MKRAREVSEAAPRRAGKQRLSQRSARKSYSDEDNSDAASDHEVQSQPTQKRTLSQRTVADSDDEDEMDGSLDFTQPDYAFQATSTQVSGSQEHEATKPKTPNMPAKIGQLSAKAVDDLTAQLVRYMLYKAGLKLPIKFGDISKEVFPKYKNVSRYFFQKAKEQLENVFGYQVVAVDDSGSKELYIILNNVTSQEHFQLVNKNGRSSTRGLLMLILGILWCAPARQISEEQLWKQLGQIDSSIKPNKDHRQLGDVAQQLKTFENQMYLESTSELDADLKKVKVYSYGARTMLEVGKVQILNFVCKLITGRPPTEMQIEEINLETS